MFDTVLNTPRVNKNSVKTVLVMFWHPRQSHSGFCLQLYWKVTLLHGCFSRFLNCTNGTNHAKHEALQNGLKKLLDPPSLTGSRKPGNWLLFERIYRNFNNFHKIMIKRKEEHENFWICFFLYGIILDDRP